ncbi:MAG: type IV conjugative transfer system lipoprotein TraV [Candidatus Competibacteraceae bacterium]
MRAIYLIIVAPITVGCSLLPVGEDEFSCPRDQYGVHCLSARQVYQATQTTDRLSNDDGKRAASQKQEPPAATSVGRWPGDGDPMPVTTEHTPAVAATVTVPAQILPASVPRTGEPLPLRTPAQVMRIWIAPWEDAAGNLHAPGAVFTDIEPRRWQIGLPALTETTALQPLQVERRESTVATAPATTPSRSLIDRLNPDKGGNLSRTTTQPRP